MLSDLQDLYLVIVRDPEMRNGCHDRHGEMALDHEILNRLGGDDATIARKRRHTVLTHVMIHKHKGTTLTDLSRRKHIQTTIDHNNVQRHDWRHDHLLLL